MKKWEVITIAIWHLDLSGNYIVATIKDNQNHKMAVYYKPIGELPLNPHIVYENENYYLAETDYIGWRSRPHFKHKTWENINKMVQNELDYGVNHESVK